MKKPELIDLDNIPWIWTEGEGAEQPSVFNLHCGNKGTSKLTDPWKECFILDHAQELLRVELRKLPLNKVFTPIYLHGVEDIKEPGGPYYVGNAAYTVSRHANFQDPENDSILGTVVGKEMDEPAAYLTEIQIKEMLEAGILAMLKAMSDEEIFCAMCGHPVVIYNPELRASNQRFLHEKCMTICRLSTGHREAMGDRTRISYEKDNQRPEEEATPNEGSGEEGQTKEGVKDAISPEHTDS